MAEISGSNILNFVYGFYKEQCFTITKNIQYYIFFH